MPGLKRDICTGIWRSHHQRVSSSAKQLGILCLASLCNSLFCSVQEKREKRDAVRGSHAKIDLPLSHAFAWLPLSSNFSVLCWKETEKTVTQVKKRCKVWFFQVTDHFIPHFSEGTTTFGSDKTFLGLGKRFFPWSCSNQLVGRMVWSLLRLKERFIGVLLNRALWYT